MSPFNISIAFLLSVFLLLTVVNSTPIAQAKKLDDKCSDIIFGTYMGCPTDDTKEMWTFNKTQKKCEAVQVDTCNSHAGNIFESETDCKTLCVSN